MPNTKCISIPSEYEKLLGFMYPTYTIVSPDDYACVTSNFIIHRDVKSKPERELLDVQYDNAIFISTQIFDELWDEDRIAAECVTLAHKYFKDRRKTFRKAKDPKADAGVAVWHKETFVQDCINYLFGIQTSDEDSGILELFDLFGSVRFINKFVELAMSTPYSQLAAAINTFVLKARKDATSLYYKKKGLLFEDLVNRNMVQAITDYTYRQQDGMGLSEAKLFADLTRK